jgi:hypothetical protein
MTHARLMRVIIVALLCASPPVALAQSSSQAEARKHFDRGFALTEQRAYAEAVEEFNHAYALSPHFAVLFNLGQCYIALGQPVYAVQALERYLSEGGKDVPAKWRNQVEADIARQETLIAAVTFHSDTPGAVIKVDGAEIESSPMPAPVRLGAGVHVFSASAPGYEPWEQKMDLVGKSRQVVEIRLKPFPQVANTTLPATPPATMSAMAPGIGTVPAAAPAGARVTPGATSGASPTPSADLPPNEKVSPATTAASTLLSAPTTDSTQWRKPVGYVIGGIGAGALVVGSVFGLRAMSKLHDSDALCPKEQCSPKGVALNKQAKTAALVSDITIGAGLASLAVATYLLITSGPPKPARAEKLAFDIRVSPGPGEASLALGGSW